MVCSFFENLITFLINFFFRIFNFFILFQTYLINVINYTVIDTEIFIYAFNSPETPFISPQVTKIARTGISTGMKKRFKDADQNQLINLMLDKSINLQKLVENEIMTQREIQRAQRACDGALRRMLAGLKALEKDEWDSRQREKSYKAQTQGCPVTTTRNAGIMRSPRKRRDDVDDDDDVRQGDDGQKRSDVVKKAHLACLGDLNVDEYEFDDDDDEPQEPAAVVEESFKSMYDLEKEIRDYAAIDPRSLKKYRIDGKYDNYSFWADFHTTLPVHFAIFRTEAPALVVQANTERVNSKASRILTPHRRNMSSENFANLMFCGSNFRLFELDPDEIRVYYNQLKERGDDSKIAARDDDIIEEEEEDDDEGNDADD